MATSPSETRQASILLVDDEEHLLDLMTRALRPLDVDLTRATDGVQALSLLKNRPFDLVICDQNMPGATGTEILQFATDIKPSPPLVILITAFGTIDMAVESMRSGAYDFIKKPFEVQEFVGRVSRALDTLELEKENRALRWTVESHYVFSEIICASKKFHDVLDLARRAAEKDSTVLLLGESGTGKDLLARAIHRHGMRRQKPFIAINCGAIPENLIESEFFGHMKGSFTGAVSNRRGCFEEVDGGTIFLDEIAEMPHDLQVKLLRVLEERKIRRVGENIERPVDFRILAATNQSLPDMVHEKRFRQDLYYRLNVLTIDLPPLRERREDITPLIENYLRKHKAEMGSSVKTVSPEALALLQAHDYPGNVRELINVLQRAVLMCDGETIKPRHLPPELGGAPHEDAGPRMASFDLKAETRRAQDAVERHLIAKALDETGGNHQQAARLLGISRGSLYNKLHKLGEATGIQLESQA